jgi:hypothetical protein
MNHYNAKRIITDTSSVMNGDILLMEDPASLNWIASNAILLPGNRAPIVNKVSLQDALNQINGV